MILLFIMSMPKTQFKQHKSSKEYILLQEYINYKNNAITFKIIT